jgi:hypothetical protein
VKEGNLRRSIFNQGKRRVFVETQSKSLTDLFPLDLEYQVRVAQIELFSLIGAGWSTGNC